MFYRTIGILALLVSVGTFAMTFHFLRGMPTFASTLSPELAATYIPLTIFECLIGFAIGVYAFVFGCNLLIEARRERGGV